MSAPVSPGRPVYETAARLFEAGVIGVPVVPWEELTRDEKDGWAKVRQAALGTGGGAGGQAPHPG